MRCRVLAGHDMNADSSRAHTIFQISLASAPHSARDEVRESKLTLVDLAGCEQQKHTGLGTQSDSAAAPRPDPARRARATLAESTAINVSLMALRQVIAARSSAQHAQHAPYRQSKLTALLKDSLSGSGRMLMVACIGPAVAHAEGNRVTLEYACMV